MSDPSVNSILTADKEPNLAFQGILHSVFHRFDPAEGIAIAFTSASPGEGVSFVSNKIASQLSANGSQSAFYGSSTQLCGESWSGKGWLDGAKNRGTGPKNTWEDWRSTVTWLRSCYRYSIIDCPSLATRSDVLSLAPHLDGIVVVVAANETHKAQVLNVERQIHMVNGKLLGYVLNKRKYMVPDWLYKHL
jgi:Mrp family chromosome partitioning ATPase